MSLSWRFKIEMIMKKFNTPIRNRFFDLSIFPNYYRFRSFSSLTPPMESNVPRSQARQSLQKNDLHVGKVIQYIEIQNTQDNEKEWVLIMADKFKNTSTIANDIMTIRKQLCLSIQQDLDEFKETVTQQQSVKQELNINSSPTFSPLYTRLLQLEQFLFQLI
ncbi:hypothetical protein DFA_04478 [Cavenderia fasciculata]|uniref:Uncharacterized protein n=1 Tax=Cavenderia fasciculata TaxID=261658 RepID=F4PPP7_CACFS|nr:uncharacterized protein DFA_04478 [Cavenderia fasciculata]EGG22360.1 hypothetical protein DFA_04478 [Cavenderia fasciculata]|eukprot:XP_004360211.1 hypothetical protein DFA_04478 [Cavenderia fasciculata]